MTREVRFIRPHAFNRDAEGVFTEDQIEAVKAKLALNPELGDLIPKTGGARKIWQFGVGGQSRVIYYFHMGDDEVFFLTCYPKNQKSDLTEDEKAELKETIQVIKKAKEAKAEEAKKAQNAQNTKDAKKRRAR
jgi:hypothetical protein